MTTITIKTATKLLEMIPISVAVMKVIIKNSPFSPSFIITIKQIIIMFKKRVMLLVMTIIMIRTTTNDNNPCISNESDHLSPHSSILGHVTKVNYAGLSTRDSSIPLRERTLCKQIVSTYRTRGAIFSGQVTEIVAKMLNSPVFLTRKKGECE